MWSDASHVTEQAMVKRQDAPAAPLSFAYCVSQCLVRASKYQHNFPYISVYSTRRIYPADCVEFVQRFGIPVECVSESKGE
jgi:hypothetical protein